MEQGNTWLNERDALTETELERIVQNNVELATKVTKELRKLLTIISKACLLKDIVVVFRSGGDSGFSWGEKLYISSTDSGLYLECSYTNYDKSGITKTERKPIPVSEFPYIAEKLSIKPEEIIILQAQLEVAA